MSKSMADGGVWQKAKILPYKNAIAAYDAAIEGLPSKIAYDGWQNIGHTIPPWQPLQCHFTTLVKIRKKIKFWRCLGLGKERNDTMFL